MVDHAEDHCFGPEAKPSWWASTKGVAEGLGLVAVAQDLGFTASLEVCADSNAAIGICRRAGIGRARHLAVAQLRARERVPSGGVALIKWPSEENPAD
eukprot:4858225-Alexandrium_andersonii.AAC.1